MSKKENGMVHFYNNLAKEYDAEQEEFAFVRIPEKELLLTAFKKVLKPDMRVLEIGAGTGRFTLEIAPHVQEVVAVDIAENMLDIMKEKIKNQNIANIQTFCGDFLDLELEGSFDLIVSFSAIEYVKDVSALFSKISRLTNTAGQLVLTTAHNTFLRMFGRVGNYFRQKIYMNAFRKKEMTTILTQYSFTVKELDDLALKSFFTKGILLFVHAAKRNRD